MHRGLNIVLNSDDAEEAVQLSTRGAGDIIAFEFSRKPPHHELYDSVFHGDELDPAKIKIKMSVGNGIMRPTSDMSRPLLSEHAQGGDEFRASSQGCENSQGASRVLLEGNQGETEGLNTNKTNSNNFNSTDQQDKDDNTLTAALQRRILELEEREKQLRSSLQEALLRRR